MSGPLGEFLVCVSMASATPALDRLRDPARWPSWQGAPSDIRFSAPAPGVSVWTRGEVRESLEGSRGGIGLAIEPGGAGDPAGAALQRWRGEARWSNAGLRGRYAYVLWDADARRVHACVDPFRTYPIYHATVGDCLLVASDLRLILATGLLEARVSVGALYHYLNFSYIPAPYCAIEGVAKLPAGHALEGRPGATRVFKHWDAVYPADLRGSDEERAAELRQRMIEAVSGFRPAGETSWGTFLSGGTDSSSIASILSRSAAPQKVTSFSIGFAEEGYDELGYSRLAAQCFGLDARERKVGEADALEAIPRLVEAFDEPFGNSSAIPTYYCADLAAQHGVRLLVAGDGGDEIYGGNERYRKDQIFEWFHRAPGIVRGAGRVVAGALKGVDTRLANRIKNFVYRGSLPNPDRFYSDDSFASDHFDALLSDGFRAQVGREDSLDVQREIYRAAQADCNLHRLMYLDLKMTIADNDVVKVVRSSRLSGTQVVFPYLDPTLIEFTGRLPGSDKVRGLEKRYLFKRATEDILPVEIRQKKKQGFGLPVSVWMRRPGPFRDMVHDILFSPRATGRGYFQPGHVEHLMKRHERGAWDHASELYILLMLELWHRHYIDGQRG